MCTSKYMSKYMSNFLQEVVQALCLLCNLLVSLNAGIQTIHKFLWKLFADI